jgi:hypothetical protein
VWIERLFDAVILMVLLLLCLMLLQPASAQVATLIPLLAAFATFSALTVLMVWVVPENVNAVAIYLLRRPSGARTTNALKALDWLYRLVRRGRLLVYRRIVTLLLLTTLIWSLEVATLGVIVLARTGEFDNVQGAVVGLLEVLSTAIAGSPATVGGPPRGSLDAATAYPLSVALPFVTWGLVLWYRYLPRRLGIGRQRR